MATLTRLIIRGYRYLNDDISDPRVKDYFLMSNPWPCFAIIVGYLYFVFEIGPNFMAKRQPFKLERVMQIYNMTQIILCAYILYKALVLGWLVDYSFSCEPVDFSYTPRAIEIANTVWLYFIVKVIDLLDTVFFVLRKKQNQVSFLHVYHHAGMVLGSWVAVKFIPGGHVTFVGLINSFVHVVMYCHYLATSFGIHRAWWKKYITQLQITQFFMLLVHYGQLIWVEDCGFPKWTAAMFIPQNLFMTILFCDFYYKTYIKKPKQQKANQNGAVTTEASNGKLKSQ